MQPPPLSLYIHIPWCIKKCPYCDFNSHVHRQANSTQTHSPELSQSEHIPEKQYLRALTADAKVEAQKAAGRKIESIFIGGGTPSLFSSQGIADLLAMLRQQFNLADDAEITLEANPGSSERNKFAAYKDAGINRLSLGIQSFSDNALRKLGRVHSAKDALRAIDAVHHAGFERWNIDLMHGLPTQTPLDAIADLQQAITSGAPHISWYQLTIEPNTAFYNAPPIIPVEDLLADIQDDGQALLADKGYEQYEVSAYANTPSQRSKHNLNYWQFGDYLAIGAGAHGKLSDAQGIRRYWKIRQPQAYMDAALENKARANEKIVSANDLGFEFAMNALRLNQGFEISMFEARTGLSFAAIQESVENLKSKGLLDTHNHTVVCSKTGHQFLNDVVQVFLNE